MIDQGSSELNIIVGVRHDDFKNAIRALYEIFVLDTAFKIRDREKRQSGTEMNILFFLKPKSEVAYVYDYGTLRQVLETMEYHKYASIPMLNKAGEYVGTITEGDLLWGIKKYTNLNLKEAENIFIQDFPRKADYEAVSADC